MNAPPPAIAVEYYPMQDRVLVYEGSEPKWQIYFTGRDELRRYLRDAVKYRGMPTDAAREVIETYEAWWAHTDFEEQRERDGVARALGLIGICLLPWAVIWGLLR